MDINKLKQFLQAGKIEIVILQLTTFCNMHETILNLTIFQMSTRYAGLKQRYTCGVLTDSYYSTELNSITDSLWQLLHCFEVEVLNLNQAFSFDEFHRDLEQLVAEFDKYSHVSNNSVRLRLKNECVRRIGEKFAKMPSFILHVQISLSEAIICGVSEKIKRYPKIDDLDILEIIAPKAQKNFTKGTLVNAIAEIIYTGELRVGSDKRIKRLLNILNKTPDMPLKKNIDRVKASLNFLLSTS